MAENADPLTNEQAGRLAESIDRLRDEQERQRQQAELEAAHAKPGAEGLARKIDLALGTPQGRAAAVGPPLSAAQRRELESRFPGMGAEIERRAGLRPPRSTTRRASTAPRPRRVPSLELPEERQSRPRYRSGAALLSEERSQSGRVPGETAADIAAKFKSGQGLGARPAQPLPVSADALNVNVVRSVELKTKPIAESIREARERHAAESGMPGLAGLLRGPALSLLAGGIGYFTAIQERQKLFAGIASPAVGSTQEQSERLQLAAAGSNPALLRHQADIAYGRQVIADRLSKDPNSDVSRRFNFAMSIPGVDYVAEKTGYYNRVAERARAVRRGERPPVNGYMPPGEMFDLAAGLPPSRTVGLADFNAQAQAASMNMSPLQRQLLDRQQRSTLGIPGAESTLKGIQEGIQKLIEATERNAPTPAFR